MKPAFVIDTSIIASSQLPDEQDAYALSVMECLRSKNAAAPSFLLIEWGNVLLCAQRARRIDAKERAEYFACVAALGLMLEPLTSEARYAARVMELANTHGLSMYDAMYLELAERYGIPIATLDKALRKAAVKTMIGIFKA